MRPAGWRASFRVYGAAQTTNEYAVSAGLATYALFIPLPFRFRSWYASFHMVPPTTKKTNLTLLIEVDVLAKLKQRAADADRTLSAEVRRVLRESVETGKAAA